MTVSGDTKLRRAMQAMIQDVPLRPAPLEGIIRRGKGIRLRRAGAAAGGLALAGIAAGIVLALPTGPAAAPAAAAAPGGVFAQGRADGHAWRLAVQNIADPGYSCVPAVVLNGTDSDPVDPEAGNLAAVSLGPSLPGVGFGFIQLPATVSTVSVNGQASVQAVTLSACGLHYRLAGFSYSLAQAARVTLANPPPGWPAAITMPQVSIQPPGEHTTPETPGLWINEFPANGEAPSGTLDSGSVYGSDWTIQFRFGTGGDCYAFMASGSAGSAQMGACGPVSTPTGPETIMALPLAVPSHPATGFTGYAVQVSPVTASLKATLSDGSSELAAFCLVDGRQYAAFVVPDPLRLTRLTWLDASGRVIATTTALPRYGFTQFQP